jgi:hypothetical protein
VRRLWLAPPRRDRGVTELARRGWVDGHEVVIIEQQGPAFLVRLLDRTFLEGLKRWGNAGESLALATCWVEHDARAEIET